MPSGTPTTDPILKMTDEEVFTHKDWPDDFDDQMRIDIMLDMKKFVAEQLKKEDPTYDYETAARAYYEMKGDLIVDENETSNEQEH